MGVALRGADWAFIVVAKRATSGDAIDYAKARTKSGLNADRPPRPDETAQVERA